MSFEALSNFWPRKWDLMLQRLILSFVIKSKNSRTLIHARARNFTLERALWVYAPPLKRWVLRSSVKCIYPEVCLFCSPLERGKPRSSEGLCHTLERGSSARRAWISCIQHFFISLQPAWAELYCLHVRSSEEIHAQAWTLFSASFEKCFPIHFCILIPS